MARPMPKTKAPAFVKNHPICQSLDSEAIGISSNNVRGSIEFVEGLENFGGAFTNQTITPAKKIIQMISCSVINVVAATTIKINHSSFSLPILFVVSL